jgi:hypothetical protein
MVVDNAQLRPLLTEPQHYGHKVMAVRTIDPRRPDDGMARRRSAHGILAGSLADAIGAQRIDRIALAISVPRRLAIEHAVGGDMDQRQSSPRAGVGDMRGAVAIDCEGKLRLAFGTVDGGICCRVDDQCGAARCDRPFNRVDVGDIGLGAAHRPNGPAGGQRCFTER